MTTPTNSPSTSYQKPDEPPNAADDLLSPSGRHSWPTHLSIGDVCKVYEPADPWPPLERIPHRLYEPYQQHYPAYTGPRKDDFIRALDEALRGIELGAYDLRMRDWIAGWDIPTVATQVSWLNRARRAGPH